MANFKTIGLFGRQQASDIVDTLHALLSFLRARQMDVIIDEDTNRLLPKEQLVAFSREELGKHCDLIIVVGGDGSMLAAARTAIKYNTPVLGINRGRLGFLTDIKPNEIDKKVGDVLDGNYSEEERFLLSAELKTNKKIIAQQDALNEVVLLPGESAHMIRFEIFINGQHVCRQRADGIIVATPTGSTAYSLSAGGPIVHPKLDAIVLAPMFPHTLSSRPIVVRGDSKIEIVIPKANNSNPNISCDGQKRVEIPMGSSIQIEKKLQLLRLIHLSNYNYYETLRSKLNWESSKL